jgi:hypothetical protein
MTLTGDRNGCPGCGKFFRSTAAFDKHRIGAFGVDRRCRTEVEMVAAGMVKRGEFWITAANPKYAEAA